MVEWEGGRKGYRDGGGGGGAEREREGVEREGGGREKGGDSNSKTKFYKDCSLGSVKNLTTSPC